MLPIPTEERDRGSDYDHLAQNRPNNRWVGIVTILIVVVTVIVVASLLFGSPGDTEPTDVTVDVTAQL